MSVSHNQNTLKEALEAMLRHYRLKPGYHQARIRELWPRLFGKTIAQYTRELRIHDRKLYVSVDSAPLRHELSMGREPIRQRLNKELGEEFLLEVIVR